MGKSLFLLKTQLAQLYFRLNRCFNSYLYCYFIGPEAQVEGQPQVEGGEKEPKFADFFPQACT